MKIDKKEQHIEFLSTLTRYQTESIQYKDEIEHLKQIYIQEYTPFLEILEDSMNSNIVKVEKKIIDKMDNLIEPFLKFIYSISNELESFGSVNELYQIFRFTWLDNDELTLFLNERNKNLTKVITLKIEKGKFFNSFKEAIERMIRKIGKHLTYNTVLNIGSKKLTDFDKRELNRSRAFYKVPQYRIAIKKYSDLLEIRLRNFIYGILKIKYGKRWQDLIPGILKEEIAQNKNRDLIHFGKYLTNDNILSYLGRGQYPSLILENYLWTQCFKFLFGDMNKNLIIDLQTISSMANLQKHLREEENLKEISYLIPQNLEKVKFVLEYINFSFQILFLPQNIYFKENSKHLYFSFVKLADQDKLDPIEIIPKDIKKFLEILKKINENDGFREKYIDLANISDLHKKFGIEYRKIIGIMGYLLKIKKIEILDYFGSYFHFNI